VQSNTEVLPAAEVMVPGQISHCSTLVMPIAVEYVPAGQGVHAPLEEADL
jgi:hypothetical protein